MNFPTEEQVRAALMEVNDPEIGINIVDLGLLYGIEISNNGIHIRMTMTMPGCPLHAYLTKAAEEALRTRFPGVHPIQVELVWEPPWEPTRMSPAARRQLGWPE